MGYILITGASAGLGEEFARQLAAEGNNLILSARREDRLQALADELKQAHSIEAQIVTADLAKREGAQKLVTQIQQQQWPLQGLINNAGFGDRGKFTELPLERQMDMLQVNIVSLTELTHGLLPLLTETTGSYIINVASTAAFQAGPNMAVYYATKAYVLSLSEALREELCIKGVSVSCLCPGPTHTEFADEANMLGTMLFHAGAMEADEVVREALLNRHEAIVIPGAKNWLLAMGTKIAPRILTRKVTHILQR